MDSHDILHLSHIFSLMYNLRQRRLKPENKCQCLWVKTDNVDDREEQKVAVCTRRTPAETPMQTQCCRADQRLFHYVHQTEDLPSHSECKQLIIKCYSSFYTSTAVSLVTNFKSSEKRRNSFEALWRHTSTQSPLLLNSEHPIPRRN